LIGILFWVGLFGTVWECLYSRRHGVAITRAEKLYLAMALPVIFAAQLVLDLVGIGVATTLSAFAMGVALNAWVLKRRIGRSARLAEPTLRVEVSHTSER
jgi:Kef-type K+ transport system membrane component KefB